MNNIINNFPWNNRSL